MNKSFLSININVFLSTTLWMLQVAGSSTKGCRARRPLPCTHLGRVYKKQRCFKENSEFVIAYEIQPFKNGCFAFLMSAFRSIQEFNGLIEFILVILELLLSELGLTVNIVCILFLFASVMFSWSSPNLASLKHNPYFHNFDILILFSISQW